MALVALAVSLVLLHGLGLVHRTLHAGSHPAHGPVTVVAVVPAGSAGVVDGFGHAAGDLACAAFDHAAWGTAAFGDGAVACSAPVPALAPASRVAVLALAPQASGHLARGPPPIG